MPENTVTPTVTIHVLNIAHKRGDDTTFHASYEALLASLADYARENWAGQAPLPGDDKEAIDAYFEDDPNDSYSTDEHTIPGAILPPALIEDLSALVQHVGDREEEDYEVQVEEGNDVGAEHHIVHEIRRLSAWVGPLVGDA